MDSGDVLAYSGEISGEVAIVDHSDEIEPVKPETVKIETKK